MSEPAEGLEGLEAAIALILRAMETEDDIKLLVEAVDLLEVALTRLK